MFPIALNQKLYAVTTNHCQVYYVFSCHLFEVILFYQLNTLLISLCIVSKPVFFTPSVMADPMEHATGVEKQELMAKAAGNDVRLSRL